MLAYIYQADIHCQSCGEAIRRHLDAAGKRPEEVDEESTYDSDDYPKGPYGNGGGEADCPQHCGTCGLFLENMLTPDGDSYVRELAAEFETAPDMAWSEIADAADEGGKPALAEWIRFYFAPGM